ncbi:phage tail fiber protein [Proteus faecis]|uniref:phage tail fiber protein n=1 Tax=Proteus faecis TaxID=2050967 RepID=UPI001889202B|nr:hypothetical protein [Proteus faecis]
MIYTTGTVSTVSGSAIVRGTGTKFKNNNPAINVGMTILIKSGNTNIPYMIKSVNSNTELVLAQPALATTTNTIFSIHITEPDNNSDAARTMVAINAYTQYFLDAMNTWMSETGQTKIEMPNGEVITLDSIKKMQGDIANRADKSTNTVQLFSGGIKAQFADAVRGNDYFGIRVHTNGTSALYGFKNGSGFDYTFPTYTGEVVLKQGSYIVNYATNDWPGIRLYKASGEYVTLEGSSSSSTLAQLVYRNSGGNNVAVVDIPKKAGTVMLVGDYGLGGNHLSGVGRPAKLLGDLPSGFYGYVTPQDIPANTTVYGDFIRLNYNSGNYQNILMPNYGNDFMVIQRVSDSSVSNVKVMTSNMWTVDSNGFYKRASPVININTDGAFTTNDESEGSTVTRVAQGAYLIKGVLGFNADAGWGGVDGGIEIPLDVNKQPLIWVDSEINKDGSILVKTYHRTHPNAPKFARNDIDGFNDGDPIDIPAGRFISVRVQMPEGSIYNVRMREMEEAQKAEED